MKILRAAPLLIPSSGPPGAPPCIQHCRNFTAASTLHSGHNRWSKIRHEKAAADSKTNKLRANFARDLTLFSKLYGPNIIGNPQLAAVVAQAKKARVPKANIDAAIARGQGRSTEGQSLQSMTFEIKMPPSVALIMDIETDNKNRVLHDLHALAKQHGGSHASTKFLFSRMGRVVLENKESAVALESVMDDAIEAGAEDVDVDDDGSVVVWTQPNAVMQLAQRLSSKLNLDILSAAILWSPNEGSKSDVGSPFELQCLTELVAALKDYPDGVGVYSNARRGGADEEAWTSFENTLDS